MNVYEYNEFRYYGFDIDDPSQLAALEEKMGTTIDHATLIEDEETKLARLEKQILQLTTQTALSREGC